MHVALISRTCGQRGPPSGAGDHIGRHVALGLATSVRPGVALEWFLALGREHPNVPLIGKSSLIGVLQLLYAVPVQPAVCAGEEGESRAVKFVRALQDMAH